MDIPFILGQTLSFLSAIAIILGMQCKSMKAILFWQSAGNLIIAISYFLLGGISGGLICLFGVLQCVIMFFYNKKELRPHATVLVGFILFSVVCSAVTGYFSRSFAEIFSAVGSVLYTFSIAQKRPAISRLIYLFNPLCWMCYDVFTKAYVSLAVHFAIFIFTGIGILRLDMMGKKKQIGTNT